jgi:anti-sigma regulatory factor (Ser/Thr protein kinase)
VDAVLIDPLEVIDDASVSIVRDLVREKSAALGLPKTVTGSLVNVASELARNQLVHGKRGRISVIEQERDGIAGLEIIALDEGNGIASPTDALLGRPRETGSLGVGLSAVLELADEVDFDVRVGEGTCVWARKFAEPRSKRRQVGIYGRPHPDEAISGDHACFVRSKSALLVAVTDGLGHGVLARDASDHAIDIVRARSDDSLPAMFGAVHEGLEQTRGAVMAATRFSSEGRAETACVGNVSVHAHGPQLARRFSGLSFVLGAPGPPRRVVTESIDLGPRDALILFTDGLTTQADADDLALLREHPLVIAHQLVKRFARTTDDALVLVAR